MLLKDVFVRGYRSIREDSISNLSSLNVFIGKNNSGKSNILQSIEVFFLSLREGEIVVLKTPIKRDLDFFNKTYVPVEISCMLSLSLTERDQLISEIASQVPEMKNAVEGIPADIGLIISLRTLRKPKYITYVSKISYLAGSKSTATDREGIIFEADEKAALELHENLSNAKHLREHGGVRRPAPNGRGFGEAG
jgi:predicted ATP-dependent endonuclease of OLD family